MLLEIGFAGVEILRLHTYPNAVNCFQQFTNRENKQLSDIDCDGDAKLTNADELVDKRSVERLISRSAGRSVEIDVLGCNKDRSNEPNAKGARGHRRIIVPQHGPRHTDNSSEIKIKWVVPQHLVETVSLSWFDDTRGGYLRRDSIIETRQMLGDR